MQEELSSLRGELVALRGDFDFLQAEVSRLRRLVVSIRANQSEVESSLPSRAAYPESDISYSLIEAATEAAPTASSGPVQAFGLSGPEQALGFAGPEQALGSSGPVQALGSGPEQAFGGAGPVQAPVSPQVRDPISWEDRDRIARGIGAWIRRCLDGAPRQSSGRDRIPLQSRYWVVVKSITGETFNPPLVFNCWYRAKDLVKRGSQTGDSIFFGVPSQREASTAILAAGLQWTDRLQG